MNSDAALLSASLAVPVLLRLMQLRPLTQTQAQQLLGTSVRSECAEGRSGEPLMREAADVALALEHVSTMGRPVLQPYQDRRSDLEVPQSHSIRLATALTQQVSFCFRGPLFHLHQAGNSGAGAGDLLLVTLRRRCQVLMHTGSQQLLLL